ncbi:unnamed protein product [Nesidiocoris tenuis]|uniref:DUF5641 domain-containing protein n=1 Tax=Nesidiocoris tenuis TaxID=355587 RepID=A0A6H5GGA2_9HEMI|nr:unnamed protein product [Nesidiocoris tenuis]
MWEQGAYDELLQEAQRCDRQLKRTVEKEDDDHDARVFTRLVLQGRLRDATRWITGRANVGGVLQLEDVMPNGATVLDTLRDKHPLQFKPPRESIITANPLPLMVDVDVTANLIEKVARSMRGSAGPSGTNASQWQNMLLRFGAHSNQLREAIASLIRRMANNNVDWNRIKALLARKAVALDKCPGVRPIAVSEVLQKICAKAMAWTTGDYLKEACGSDQLSAGLKSGIEGAVHSMSAIFEEDQTECILLVDARNAFNQLSRPLALWNARIFWPRCARFLFNSYRGYPLILFRQNNAFLLSREGTTQGDPLGAMMYAAGTLQLIKELKSPNRKQMWYADDSSCAGSIARLPCDFMGPRRSFTRWDNRRPGDEEADYWSKRNTILMTFWKPINLGRHCVLRFVTDVKPRILMGLTYVQGISPKLNVALQKDLSNVGSKTLANNNLVIMGGDAATAKSPRSLPVSASRRWPPGNHLPEEPVARLISGCQGQYSGSAGVPHLPPDAHSGRSLPLSADPEDLEPLTPGHFLVGQPLTSLPEPNYQHIPTNRLNPWQRVQERVQYFWGRWQAEYLASLQLRAKWDRHAPNQRVGDLVLIRDTAAPPAQWPLGRIQEVHPGSDDIVRVVTVRTSGGTNRRPAVKMIPLRLGDLHE